MGTDFVIMTRDPELLGRTLDGLPNVAATVLDDFDGEKVTICVLGDVGFAEFAIRQQGYGEIVSITPRPDDRRR